MFRIAIDQDLVFSEHLDVMMECLVTIHTVYNNPL